MPSGLSDSIGSNFGPLASYALAAVIVLVLIILVLFIAKRVLGGGMAGHAMRKGPRLAVLDIAAIDQRRKLVLVRRDEVEHLVLVGGQNDLLVEGNITRGSPALQPQERFVPGRVEPEALGPDAVQGGRFPPVARLDRQRAPETQAQRSPSPLRRPVPRPEPRPPAEDVDPPALVPVQAPVSRPTVEAARPVLVEPTRTAEPAIVAAAVPVRFEAARRPETVEEAAPDPIAPERAAETPDAAAEPVAPVEDSREAKAPEVILVPKMEPEPEAETALELKSAPEAPKPEPEPEPEQRIPSFLRRTDFVPPARPKAVEPIDVPAPAPVETPSRESADPERIETPARQEPIFATPPFIFPEREETIDFPRETERRVGTAGSDRDEPATERTLTADRDEEAKPQDAEAPAGPAVAAAPPEPVQPEPPPRLPATPIPARFTFPARASAVPETRAPSPVPDMELPPDESERRPLSVRSFATAIQTRRQNFEAVKPMDTWTGRAAQALMPPPIQPPASQKPAPEPDDASLLDEALTRELDSGIGSLDWANEAPKSETRLEVRHEPEVAIAPPTTPAPPPPTPARALTLEEEMERLLGDFDMSNVRR